MIKQEKRQPVIRARKLSGNSTRGIADMNVRPGSRPAHGMSKRDKGNARAAQISHQGLSCSAVRTHRHVY